MPLILEENRRRRTGAEMLRTAGRWRAYVALAMLVLCVAWLIGGIWWSSLPTADGLHNRIGRQAGGDFVAFYGAARLAVAGKAAEAYDVELLTRTIAAILGGSGPSFQWPYPPSFFLALAPLGWLEPRAALAVWLAIGALASICLAARLIESWRFAWLGVVFPGVSHALIAGQSGALVALLLGLGFAAFERRPVAAGIAFGLLSLKPQFAIAPFALALALGRWPALYAMGLTAAAAAAASAMAFGISPWLEFLNALGEQSRHVIEGRLPVRRMTTPVGTAIALGQPLWVGLFVWTAVAAVSVGVLTSVWRRTAVSSTRALALGAAALLATPYAFDYDLAILVLPFACLIADWRADGRLDAARSAALIVIMWLAPVSYLVARAVPVPVASLGLFALLWLAWRMSCGILKPQSLGTKGR